FESQFTIHNPWFLKDHKVGDSIVVPATAYIEMALESLNKDSIKFGSLNSKFITISDITIERALILKENYAIQLKFVLNKVKSNGNSFHFQIYSKKQDDNWLIHAYGNIIESNTMNKYPYIQSSIDYINQIQIDKIDQKKSEITKHRIYQLTEEM